MQLVGQFVAGMLRALGSRFVVAYATTRVVSDTLVDAYSIEGQSMAPTLNPDGDVVLVNRLVTLFPRDLARGDVVVAKALDDPMTFVCKRIAALEGDTVQVVDNAETGAVRTCTVGKGKVWLVGDNGKHSYDSRHYGDVPHALIKGRVLGRVWPLRELGPLSEDVPPSTASVVSSRATTTSG